MEYRDDFRNKVPFYMTYPMQNLYLTEMEYEKDMERMKELYPREVRQLQKMVERRCDEMEYEGSRMYDENPDRYMLEEEARRLYEQFLRENPQYNSMMPLPMPRPEGPMDPRPMPQRPGMPMEPGTIPQRPGMPVEPGTMPQRPDMPMNPGNISSQPDAMDPRSMPRFENRMEQGQNDMQMQQYRRNREDSWLHSLISILFHDEIYRRRCRNRRCRRWW